MSRLHEKTSKSFLEDFAEIALVGFDHHARIQRDSN